MGLSRRHLEGRNTPFREYDPVGVRPTSAKIFNFSSRLGAQEDQVFFAWTSLTRRRRGRL